MQGKFQTYSFQLVRARATVSHREKIIPEGRWVENNLLMKRPSDTSDFNSISSSNLNLSKQRPLMLLISSLFY